jgi:hypothetical protein
MSYKISSSLEEELEPREKFISQKRQTHEKEQEKKK